MKDVMDLILELAKENVSIYLEDSKLKIDTPGGVSVEAIVNKIRPKRERVIEYLSNFTSRKVSLIPPAEISDSYPVSSSQRRLWILSQLEEASVAYNMPSVYVFTGAVDKAAIDKAFNTIVQRHEILRTVFFTDEAGEIRQVVKPSDWTNLTIKYYDLRSSEDSVLRMRQLIAAHSTSLFDLSKGPLIRAQLLQIGDEKWIFQYTMHHIISDGWSMKIMINELLHLYNAGLMNREPSLSGLTVQYKDYSVWQQEKLKAGKLEMHRQYWLDNLSGILPVLEMPADITRPAFKTYQGGVVSKRLNSSLTGQLKKIAHEQEATLFMVLLAAVNVFLYRYSGQTDIIVGSPVANREHTDMEGQIGFFINTLPLRSKFSGKESFKDMLAICKDTALRAYRHQSYPFDELVDQLELKGDMSRNALFDVMLVLQNTDVKTVSGDKNPGGMIITAYEEAGHVISKFDLLFDFAESGDELQFGIEYSTDIFHQETAGRMALHFEQMISEMAKYPDAAVSSIDLLNENEKEVIIAQLDASAVAYPESATIVDLFEASAAAMPDNPAVKYGSTELNYRTLNEKANRLADYLKKIHGVNPGELVAIQLERSEWLIVAILGILKAGAAYVPVDPDYPQDRIDYMLADSNCTVVIDASLMAAFSASEHSFDSNNVLLNIAASDLAYVIYTSGTTGQPKGSLVEHGNVVRLFNTEQPLFDFGPADVWTMFHSFCFDFSVWEMYGALFFGGKLIVVPAAAAKDPQLYLALLAGESVTVLNQTPSAFYNLIQYEQGMTISLQQLRYVIFGGEALSPSILKNWVTNYPAVQLINMYGITETTVHVTFKKLTAEDIDSNSTSIGKPVPTLSCYVLNENLQLVPYGVSGELYVGGKGVCRGYLNKPELTAERFIQNPFRQGERLYKSGDKVRLLSTGDLLYSGRIDDQVKIRGYRIELGEIVNALSGYEGVSSCTVQAIRNEHGENELAAYLVCSHPADVSLLRTYLSKTLPGYMVPGYYVQLDALPLTQNGKIDKQALPGIQGLQLATGVDYVAPVNDVEARLLSIWSAVLGLEESRISTRDNFFDLGGHSLKAARLAAKIHQAFEVKIDLRQLFTITVLQDQALLIAQTQVTAFAGIPSVALSADYPLSSSQRRLWLLSQLDGGSAAYNISGEYILEGSLDRDVLEASFTELISRHEVLRTVFRSDASGEARQVILPADEQSFTITVSDLRSYSNSSELIQERLSLDKTSIFNLSTGPLLRASLYRLEEEKWLLSYVLHHIISDGWSMGILLRELMVIYNSLLSGLSSPLEALRIQYKDYAVWQQEQLAGSGSSSDSTYWLSVFSDSIPVLDMPVDMVRPSMKTYNGGVVHRMLPVDLCDGLRDSGHAAGATLFMSLLTVVNILLSKYSRQYDIVIGSPVAGRGHSDLEDQIGFYVNTLALRTRFDSGDSYDEVLGKVKEVTLGGYQHQSYPFDELLDKLNLQRDLGRNPLFDVLVVLQHAGVDEGLLPVGLTRVAPPETGYGEHVISKFDLSFNFSETASGLRTEIEFNTDLYRRSTIERLADHFIQLSSVLIASPSVPISQLQFLSPSEEASLHAQYNFNLGAGYDRHATLVGMFEEQAYQHGKREALVFGSTRMSYATLNGVSNRLGGYLRSKYQIGREDKVAICLERSEWLVVAILGVLKSGGAYVPIDPDYPEERKAFMLSDSGSKVLIDEAELLSFRSEESSYSTDNLPPVNQSGDLAYIIYTSGTTGNPKGVMIEHGNVVRLLKTEHPLFDFNEQDVWTMFHSFCFDFSVWEMYGALLSGGRLVVVSLSEARDPSSYLSLLKTEGVTVLNQTPSSFYQLIQQELLASVPSALQLRYVIFGGEALRPGQLSSWHMLYPGVKLINMYGITETTVHVTCRDISAADIASDSSNIGKAIPTLGIYVLDEQQQLVPYGVMGEMYVGGSGVSRGYLNRPDLTASRFIDNPFVTGDRLYRTGDLGRWLEDGSVEFMGRIDEQVKIRGYRIEPGEVAAAIRRLSGVHDAVVTARKQADGDTVLVGYIVGEAIDPAGIRTQLQSMLPGYMVPAYLMELASLPLTANGKLALQQLPAPDFGLSGSVSYVAPRTATEASLQSIWSSVLDLPAEQISVEANFFDLGGHSLKVTRLSGQLYRDFGVQPALRDLFTHTTIVQQALLIAGSLKSTYSSIKPAPSSSGYALSSSQRRLWILSQFEGASVAYNIPGAYELEGNIDVAGLNHSFGKLISRHEILRTVLKEGSDGEVLQYILPAESAVFSTGYCDLREVADADTELHRYVEHDFTAAFDLSSGTLLRATLYHLTDKRSVLTYVMHHIISDGWSMGVLIKEVLGYYKSYQEGSTTTSLPALAIQYKDYAHWQSGLLSSAAMSASRLYWLGQFAGPLPVVDIACDHPRPLVKTYSGGSVRSFISGEAYLGLKSLSQEAGGTLFMGLLSLVNVLLYRYTGQEDIITGTPVAGRDHPDLEDQIGFYANTLALRSRFKGSDSYRMLLGHVREVTLGAYSHQQYPFDELVGELELIRDRSRHPLFDIQVILETAEHYAGNLLTGEGTGSMQLEEYGEGLTMNSVFDLVFSFAETGGGLGVSIRYNSDVYSRELADQLSAHLQVLCSSVLEEPDMPISALPLLDAPSRQKLEAYGMGKEEKAYTTAGTLVSQFSRAVSLYSSHTAVVYGSSSMSYASLDERSTRLALYLREQYGLCGEHIAAIMTDRSDWLLVAILGVLKSGAAYVPVDPAYPRSRKSYMLSDTGASVLLTQSDYIFDLDYYEGPLTAIDIEWDSICSRIPESGMESLPEVSSHDLAYVIYTSGSTGRPKGVQIEHGSVLNTILSQVELFGAVPFDHHLQFASCSFDASVSEIFVSLLSGGVLYIVEESDKRDPALLCSYLRDNGISIATLPPAFLRQADLSLFMSLKHLITAGEAAIREQGNIFLTSGNYSNAYGPTEASICATVYSRQHGSTISSRRVPIGVPIANSSIYIVDSAGELCAPGVTGEIYIGGAGLSRGYLNLPAETAAKFITNPFGSGRLYRSGDLGRWTSSGELDFMGRIDGQYKVNGYRIEPAEIEVVLCGHPSVQSVSVQVLSVGDSGLSELAAYIVFTSPGIDASSLRSYALDYLPLYMVPGRYTAVASLPLNASGKVDRAALLSLSGDALSSGSTYVAAVSELEHAVIGVYEEVLKRSGIGMSDDFFVLGGDSIKAIQVVSRLKHRGYGLSIQDVLVYPVVNDLCKVVKRTVRIAGQGEVIGAVSLSPVQRYFFEQYPINNHHYNQSVLLYSATPVSFAGLESVLGKMIAHHDGLRMRFRKTGSGWEQENRSLSGIKGQVYAEEISSSSSSEISVHFERMQSSMELDGGLLFKALLVHSADGDRLLLVAHHLVVDGVTWRILLEDLSNLYQQYLAGDALQLPSKTDSFQYWQQQQLEYAQSEVLRQELGFWSSIEGSLVSPLELDNAAGSNLMRDVETVSFSLSEALTSKLQTGCYHAYHTQINDILLSALLSGLQGVFTTDRVLVSLEGHGRESLGFEADISRTTGWFTTWYPVVLSCSADMTEQLVSVKETLHRVPNKGIGYGILRYITGAGFNCNPEIGFNYLGDFGSGLPGKKESNTLFEYAGEYRGSEIAGPLQRAVKLDVTGMIGGGQLHMTLSYSSAQYKASTIDTLAVSYRSELEKLILELSAKKDTFLTPVDLTYKNITIEQLSLLNEKRDVEDIYGLSPLQSGLFYHWLIDPASPAYFIQTSYLLKGKMNIALLKSSYEKLLLRHASLRTFFTQDIGETVLQVVKKQAEAVFIYRKVSDEENFSAEAYKKADLETGFDLCAGSQMRLSVLDFGNDAYEFIWSHHHIIMDGWCTGILVKEFFQLYYAAADNKTAELDHVYPYSDYISWLDKLNKKASIQYWGEYLEGIEKTTRLWEPGSDSGLVGTGYRALKKQFGFSAEVVQKLRKLCGELGVTESNFIQTAWGILMGHYTVSTDVVFGSVVSGRPAELKGVEGMVGIFSNTVPVRLRWEKESSVIDVLRQVQQDWIAGSLHHYVQLAEVQSLTSPGRDLFNQVMVIENFPVQEMLEQSIGDADIVSLLSSDVFDQTNYDFTITVFPGERLEVKFDCNSNLYQSWQIEQLQQHFISLVGKMADNPEKKISEIIFLSQQEEQELSVLFNDTAKQYGNDNTLIGLFENQACQTPELEALICGTMRLNYRELNREADQLSTYVKKHYRVGKGDIVGIMLERTEKMIVSILAVLKCGAAYVPIDTALPASRKEFVMNDTAMMLLITEADFIFNLDYFKGEIFAVDIQPTDKNTDAGDLHFETVGETDLAYVIYTSGSTGTPKGVMIEHGAIVNTILAQKEIFGVQQGYHHLQFASCSFDASVSEIFVSLLSGGSLFIISDSVKKDPVLLRNFLADNSIDVATIPPAYLQLLESDDVKPLKRLITAGEQAVKEKAAGFAAVGDYYNAYGPTETSICATVYKNPMGGTIEGNKVPIGRPITNTHIYILNENGNLCAKGVIGEICIGGRGLARGYLNREADTSAKFIADPFRKGERLYKTGDMGRWLQNGDVDFVGRVDNQVKVRGYRIELGEIENVIQKYESVELAVVAVRSGHQHNQELIAYISGKDNLLDIAALKAYISGSLPAYMLPHHYIIIDEWPLNNSGKIDKARLPLPEEQQAINGTDYTAPRTETESRLQEMWSEILGMDKTSISVKDDFFALGGHSLKVIQLITRVRKEFGVNPAIESLFKNPTVEFLAGEIEKINLVNNASPEIESDEDVEKFHI